jgi:hypothetical protein
LDYDFIVANGSHVVVDHHMSIENVSNTTKREKEKI